MKYPIGIQSFEQIIEGGYVYLGKKDLFKGLAIDRLEKEWKQYPVFHLR